MKRDHREVKASKVFKIPFKKTNKQKTLTFSQENELTTLATSDYRNVTNLRCKEVDLLHLY